MNMESLTKTQIVLLVLLVSFVTSLATGIVTVTLVNQAPQPITHTISKVVEKLVPKEVPVKEKTVIFSNEENLVKVIKEASLAVVSIVVATAKDLTATTTPTLNLDQNVGESRSSDQSVGAGKKPMPTGSGFFISKDGTILTNRHIVEDAALEYVAITSDGKTYPASVISRSSSQDVAVLKVEGNNFNFIPLGDSKNINVGQTAIALGSDSGEFQNTVSVGVVSGLNKVAAALNSVSGQEDLVALIQIDAATNPGNSGGPLVDLNGRAIGINTVGAPRENIGFALPINLAKKDIADASKLEIRN